MRKKTHQGATIVSLAEVGDKKGRGKTVRSLVVSGLGGGTGKSVVTVGLIAALREKGRTVAPFKKGPDYIDAGWLSLAAGQACFNLDPYLIGTEQLRRSFFTNTGDASFAIIEGNRGLFDGVDIEGGYSTAELAILLGLPVLLVVDCTKVTRTVAAMVLGCREFDKRLHISGVILNRIARSRHQDLVAQAVERYTGIPVLGALPKMSADAFPQRHLGITPFQEHGDAHDAVQRLAAMVALHLDLDRVIKAMEPIALPGKEQVPLFSPTVLNTEAKVRIGVIRDSAFQFYYEENLLALVQEGAELVEINALVDRELPALDALYIGGGFPETSLGHLAGNHGFLASLRAAAEAGLPIYAECGGLIYLGTSMVIAEGTYQLAGVFPVAFGLEKKPQAHGYTILEVTGENPFYPLGSEIKGHEFRYSKVLDWRQGETPLALTMRRGVGFAANMDGLVYKNVLALYTHVHALGTPAWALGLVAKARQFRDENRMPS